MRSELKQTISLIWYLIVSSFFFFFLQDDTKFLLKEIASTDS